MFMPSEQQISALADQIPLGFDPNRDRYTNTHEAASGIAASPAFGAIIASAQAAVLRGVALGLEDALPDVDDMGARSGMRVALTAIRRTADAIEPQS